MNVFEDLIGELKNENLLEETVIEVRRNEEERLSSQPVPQEQAETAVAAIAQTPDIQETNHDGGLLSVEVVNEPLETPSPLTAKEFYRKRAVDEVSSLQMVDHVIAGVEREYMKIVPRSYDDLSVKKALHSFLQVAGEEVTDDQAQLEFQLMQEIENWCSALAHRDKDIAASDLRRYCENSRPALSSQALIALAKFYRNLPYSDSVRNKFDFVVTRLFSKEIAAEKRFQVFGREEMIEHFKSLYADWSSISLYSAEDDNSDILVAALRFADFIGEADAAESFDDLIRSEFFQRLREFKESLNEMFFAPIITSAAVECNVRVGNVMVDLLTVERSKRAGEEELYEKYGIRHDQSVSDATSRTVELVEMLREREEEPQIEQPEEFSYNEPVTEKVAIKAKAKVKKAPNKLVTRMLGVNKGLLFTTIIVLLLSIGVSIWSEKYAGENESATTAGVQNFELESSMLKEHIATARVSNEVFYGIVSATWNELSRESKEEFVQKVVKAGKEKGYNKVQLSDPKGKVVATGTTDASHAKVR